MKLKVWTEAYRPFIMGGDVNAPISTEIEVGEKVDLGKGIGGYLVCSPSGKTFVAEATTGAFIGGSIEQVKSDIADATPEIMQEQLVAAKRRAKSAEPMKKEKFWGMFK